MERLYKLTTQDFKTRKGWANECTWGPGITHSGTGKGNLCGPGYIHAYTSPLLAVLLNPIHANIKNPVLWECSHSGIEKNDRGLKVGCLYLCTVEQISLPEISVNQKVAFGILCAMHVCKIPGFTKWALAWLDESDRTSRAAYAADAAYTAAYAAAYAVDAAYTAAYAAAYAAADAAYAADAAAYAAARANKIDFIALAKQSLTYN